MQESREKEKLIVNDAGKKVSVIMSYQKYRRLMEDLHDLSIVAERRNEESISFEELKSSWNRMASYKLVVRPGVSKDVKSIPKATLLKVRSARRVLADEPCVWGSSKLQGA